MDTQPCGPDEAFARDLAELDRELEVKAPGSLARMQAGIALRRSGASLLAEGRPADA